MMVGIGFSSLTVYCKGEQRHLCILAASQNCIPVLSAWYASCKPSSISSGETASACTLASLSLEALLVVGKSIAVSPSNLHLQRPCWLDAKEDREEPCQSGLDRGPDHMGTQHRAYVSGLSQLVLFVLVSLHEFTNSTFCIGL